MTSDADVVTREKRGGTRMHPDGRRNEKGECFRRDDGKGGLCNHKVGLSFLSISADN